ncbi:hypothetical protein DL96DRAFT_1760072 [Flagelloscypha sp. PMI_526]|nr:hypothetical protein DL96DRAFT_1760072 [Flagelloscypha sp. PMI_526]
MSSELPQNGRHLPEELFFYILEIFLDSPLASSSVHLLLVSKRMYHWALPKLYRNLKFSPDDDRHPGGGVQRARFIEHASPQSLPLVQNLTELYLNRKFSPEDDIRPHGGIQRARFMAHAPRKTLLLVQHLQCGTTHNPDTFYPFQNLKRLALWGQNLLHGTPANSVLDLSLEELFIWDRGDLRIFERTVEDYRWFGKQTLYRRLRKISSRIWATLEEPDERGRYLISDLLSRKSRICCIFHSWKDGQTKSQADSNGRELMMGLRDCRVVRMQIKLNHLSIRDADPNVDFWEEQNEMWRQADKAVTEKMDFKIVKLRPAELAPTWAIVEE